MLALRALPTLANRGMMRFMYSHQQQFIMRYWILLLIFALSTFSIFAQSTDCPVDFAGYLAPRLIVGQQARVLPDTVLNIRPQPSLDIARVGSVSSGASFTVLAEPQCAAGFVWWFGEIDGIQGWIAEGSIADNEYYLEPRGELILLESETGEVQPYIRTVSGFLEPEGCVRPLDDYERMQLGYASLNARTVFMLEQAQRIYEQNGGRLANFRQLITQGSYNPGAVDASFGTHDGGGAVDIAVRNPADFSVMETEIMPMIHALRTAGFAAWLRAEDELYDGSVIHIHAIAIGDAESSPIAQQQVSSEFGYLQGFNGLPAAEGASPTPDIYGEPIICEWMVETGFVDMRESAEVGR
jgi:hypothetical protein